MPIGGDRFEVAGDLAVTHVFERMDYENFDVPTKVWWIRYVDSVDDYQVTLQADGGTVENISNQGDIFGVS